MTDNFLYPLRFNLPGREAIHQHKETEGCRMVLRKMRFIFEAIFKTG
jgi:hypothetical protein